jgi:transcriptional regulator with XRE-family HTH domain
LIPVYRTAMDDANKRLAVNLRGAREQAEMTQTELAQRMRDAGHLGFTQQFINRIEHGQRRVSYTEAIDLARALGTTADALARPPGLASRAADLVSAARELRAAVEAKAVSMRRAEDALMRARRQLALAENDGLANDLEGEMARVRWALAAAEEGGGNGAHPGPVD